MTGSVSTVRPPSTRSRALVAGAGAAVGAAVAVNLVAVIGKAAGAPHVKQLGPGPLTLLTVVGVAVGTAVWMLIRRRSADPARLLRLLVPTVLVLSLVPDVALGIGNTAWSAVVTLMVAHVAVFAVAVPVLLRFLPPDGITRPTDR